MSSEDVLMSSEDELTCLVCLDIMADPVILSCSGQHRVCKSHIQELVGQGSKCPSCKTVVDMKNCPVDRVMKNLCDEVRRASPGSVGIRGRSVVHYQVLKEGVAYGYPRGMHHSLVFQLDDGTSCLVEKVNPEFARNPSSTHGDVLIERDSVKIEERKRKGDAISAPREPRVKSLDTIWVLAFQKHDGRYLVATDNCQHFVRDVVMLMETGYADPTVSPNKRKSFDSNGLSHIYVVNMRGKRALYEVSGETRVAELKRMIQDKDGISPEQFRLLCSARVMQDGKKLADYNLQNLQVLQLVTRYKGGMMASDN